MYSVYKETDYGKHLEFEAKDLDEVFERLNHVKWYPYQGYYIYLGSLEQEERCLGQIFMGKKGANK